MNEHTLVKTMQLPFGQPWTWYGDANVLVLSPDLKTEEQRQNAISEAVAHWRRNFLRVVPEQSYELPMARLSTWHTCEGSRRASGAQSSGIPAGGA